jgi:large subunit ribosomal protein L9
MAKYHILLLEDVINYGRKGDLVHVAPGFARNYLLPEKKALLATRTTLKLRERLQEERKKQAEVDRKESEKLAQKLEGRMFETTVKVDSEGNLYGSVTAADICEIMGREGFLLHKKNIAIHHAVKTLGTHHILLKLPEGVEVVVGLVVKPDREIVKREKVAEVKAKEEANVEAEASNEEANQDS